MVIFMNKRQKEILQAQLNEEKKVLGKLEKNYEDALAEINSKIEILMARQDADLQHVIYQIEYQKALKTQIQAILEQLQTNEFETLSEYLSQSYEDGFIGTMYDLQGQGIPLVFPIDQEQIVAAIQHETKLSEDLYTTLGRDVKDLQKKIAGEISRGISTGMMYSEIARNISGYARIPKNNAMRIARTEAHRIQCKATADAQFKAKEHGADVVKQWDASLDKKTRKSHRELDGQIRELEDEFEVGSHKAMHPGAFGIASEDINCRCALLQRARWALEDDIPATKWSPDAPIMIDDDGTTQFVDISDAKNYQDFKDKYKQSAERVRSNAPKIKDNNKQRTLEETTKITRKKHSSDYGVVDREIVNSKKYHDKYENLTKHKEANESIYQETMKMLEHRDGTGFEDMVAIDVRTGKIVVDVTDSTDIGKLTLTQNQYDKIVNHASDVVLVHNHPNGSRPSYTDILKLKEKNISAVVAAGHDGSVYVVSNLKNDFDIEIFWEEAYNTYKQIYQDDILAEHHATDDLYELGVFDVERR